MPTPPNFRYRWNDQAAQYIDLATGRFVSSQSIRDQLEKAAGQSGQAIQALSQQLRDDDISPSDWQDKMVRQVFWSSLR